MIDVLMTVLNTYVIYVKTVYITMPFSSDPYHVYIYTLHTNAFLNHCIKSVSY